MIRQPSVQVAESGNRAVFAWHSSHTRRTFLVGRTQIAHSRKKWTRFIRIQPKNLGDNNVHLRAANGGRLPTVTRVDVSALVDGSKQSIGPSRTTAPPVGLIVADTAAARNPPRVTVVNAYAGASSIKLSLNFGISRTITTSVAKELANTRDS